MRLPTLLLLGALTGCRGPEATFPGFARMAGSWALESVNGAPLPATASNGLQTLSSRFVAANGSFTITSVVRVPTGDGPAELTTLRSGHYYCGHVGCAPQLLIFDGSGGNADAEAGDATLTVYETGSVLLYRRE